MIYRITVKSNPRILILLAGLLVLLAAGVVVFIFIGPLLGVIAIGAVGFIGYTFVKKTVYHMRSTIESSDKGLAFSFPGDQQQMFRWKDITYAAYCIREGGTPCIVVYKEKEDRLMSVPREFEDFDHLLQEVRRRIKEVPTLELGKKELIEDKLKVVLGFQDSAADTGEAESVEESDGS